MGVMEKISRRTAAREQFSVMLSRFSSAGVTDGDWYWRPIGLVTAFFLFAGLSAITVKAGWQFLDRPITAVRVVGETRHLDKPELAARVGGEVESNLLSLSLSQVREQVLEEPWVHEVEVSRSWPPALTLTVDEEVPVARWGDKGLLNHQGDIFWPELKPEYQALPRLSGPASDTAKVMAKYHDLSRMFQNAGIRLSGLSLEARGAWTLTLGNGVRVIAGRELVAERLVRFLSIYQRSLTDKAEKIDTIDTRYTNGVAVKWHPQADPEAPKEE